MPSNAPAEVEVIKTDEGRRVELSGYLTVAGASIMHDELGALNAVPGEKLEFCLHHIKSFDTAGAWLLYRTMRDLRFDGSRVKYINAVPEYEQLIEQALVNDAPCTIAPPMENSLLTQVEEVGEGVIAVLTAFGSLLSFLGQVLVRIGQTIVNWKRLRVTSLVFHMEHIGLKATPIVGLISFLIGLVMVQQGSVQLKRFGADVFVVDLVGVTTLRELGGLLTAIIVAGRSGSAFTAQIGSMKLNEEIDAMRTIGIDPFDTLILPRIFALILMMPILTFYADFMGLVGGGLIAWASLDISPNVFLTRLLEAVSLTDFYVGLIKACVFGLIIGVSGCFEGLNVKGGATSVGERTTRSVVQSIFLVIVLDAFFAVFFTFIGW